MGVILASNPHRVFASRLGRIEVFQPIPPVDGKSPTGPHPTSSPSCWRLVAPTRPPSHCRPAGFPAPISTRRIPLATDLVGTDPSSVSATPHSKSCWLTTGSSTASSSRGVLSSPSSPATNLLECRWTAVGSPAPRCVWLYGSCWHRASYRGRLPLGFQPTTVSTRAMPKMQQRRTSGPNRSSPVLGSRSGANFGI